VKTATSPSRVTFSCITTASAPAGTPAPVKMRIAVPGRSASATAPVPNINTAADDRAAVISADGRTIYFASASGRNVGFSIRMATRATTKDAFSFPIEAPGLAPLQDESKGFSAMPGWISPDNCRLYLNTNFDGTQDIYVAWRH
jgi:hypothetical protein